MVEIDSNLIGTILYAVGGCALVACFALLALGMVGISAPVSSPNIVYSVTAGAALALLGRDIRRNGL
jgi:hypothetical protein